MMRALRPHWESMSARDQRAVRLGVTVALALFLLAALLMRLEQHHAVGERLRSKIVQLDELQQRLNAGSALRSSAALDGTTPASREQLTGALRASGLEVLQPAVVGNVWRVAFQDVAFPQVVELERALARQGIAAARFELKQGSTAGQVSGHLEWRIAQP